ncbi:MAG: hypothetical protein VX424_08665 [Actinomycetota bacterium]|nr:hypothetical protein [Actinomycetota bacterium]
MAKVRVAQGFQCVHDGEVFDSGDTADVPDAVAQRWVAEGWASGAAPKSKGSHR